MRKKTHTQQAYLMKVMKKWEKTFKEYKRICFDENKLHSTDEQYEAWSKFEDVTRELITACRTVKNKNLRYQVEDLVETWISWAG